MKRFNVLLLSAAVGLAGAGVFASGAQAAFVYTVDVWSYNADLPGASTSADPTNQILSTAPTYVFNYNNGTINWSTPGPQNNPGNTGLNFIPDWGNVQWVSGVEADFQNNLLSVPGDATASFFKITATWTSPSTTTGNLTSDDGSTLIIGGSTLVNMAGEQQANTQSFIAGAFNNAPLELLYVEGNGAPAVLDFNISGGSLTQPVPEASTWAMMILGFFGVGCMAYRRKSKPALRLA